MSVDVLLFAERPGDRYRAGRTTRALARAGVTARDVSGPPGALAAALAEAPGPGWLGRARARPAPPRRPPLPPPRPPRLPAAQRHRVAAVRAGGRAARGRCWRRAAVGP